MTLRVSKALRNLMLQNGSLRDALENGKLLLYSGAQPATPETAPSGTLLCAITNNAGAHTAEVQATGTVTLTGGAAGSVDTITVNGVDVLGASVPYNTSLDQTAADCALQINRYRAEPEYVASASGAVITLTAKRGRGATPNGHVVSATLTTVTASYANMSGGVTPVNGLKFDVAVSGVIPKLQTQTWGGVAGSSGTAGWFRFVGSVADSGLADSTESQVRLDGAVGTSGSDINMSSTNITSGATQSVSSFTITFPTN